MPVIAVIPGDGIGNEVVPEAVKVLETLHEVTGMDFEYQTFDYGSGRYLRTGEAIPENISEIVQDMSKKFDAILFGAGGVDARVPLGINAQPIYIALRRDLDLYANQRPCRLYDARLTPLKGKIETDINFMIIRESTEGFSALPGGNFRKGTLHEVAVRQDVSTGRGVHRIIKFAFEYAKKHKLSRVTLGDKTRGDSIWVRVLKEVAKGYPEIEGRHLHVDNMAYQMIIRPEQFQVIVTENRFGDIASDMAAALHGGLGLSPAGVVNAETGACYFEPVHGTGPDIAGRNLANPFAAILAARMMLDHLGFQEQADLVEKAVVKAIKDGETTTDIGGKLGTTQVGEFVRRTIRKLAS